MKIFLGTLWIMSTLALVYQIDSKPKVNSDILGKWISAQESAWTIEFKEDYCIQSYSQDVMDTLDYSMARNHRCEEIEYSTLDNIVYLSLWNSHKNFDDSCYEITSLYQSNLSLRNIETGMLFSFNKAK